jgi:hypothetical protein
MAGASDYLENKLLDHIVGKTSYSMPTAYIALCTTAPTDASTGSTIVEANYTGYARKSTSGSDWEAASSGHTQNAGALTFGACSAGSSTVTHFAVCDASSGGNMLFFGSLGSSLAVSTGITPEFAAGDLDVYLD